MGSRTRSSNTSRNVLLLRAAGVALLILLGGAVLVTILSEGGLDVTITPNGLDAGDMPVPLPDQMPTDYAPPAPLIDTELPPVEESPEDAAVDDLDASDGGIGIQDDETVDILP